MLAFKEIQFRFVVLLSYKKHFGVIPQLSLKDYKRLVNKKNTFALQKKKKNIGPVFMAGITQNNIQMIYTHLFAFTVLKK